MILEIADASRFRIKGKIRVSRRRLRLTSSFLENASPQPTRPVLVSIRIRRMSKAFLAAAVKLQTGLASLWKGIDKRMASARTMVPADPLH